MAMKQVIYINLSNYNILLILIALISFFPYCELAGVNTWTDFDFGTSNTWESGRVISQCPNGDLLMAGIARPGSNKHSRGYIVRVAANGDFQQQKIGGCNGILDNNEHNNEVINVIICVSDGFYLGGRSVTACDGTGNPYGYIYKFNNDWTTLALQASFRPGYHPQVSEITYFELLPGNDIIAVGYAPINGVDIAFVLKLSSTNVQVYRSYYTNIATCFTEIRLIDNVNAVAVGYMYYASKSYKAIICIVEIMDGDEIKCEELSDACATCLDSVTKLKNGGFIAVGYRYCLDTDKTEQLLIKYDNNLAVIYKNERISDLAHMRRVKQVNNENLIVVGWLHNGATWGAWVAFFDTNAKQIDSVVFNESHDRLFYDVVLTKDDGSLAIVGDRWWPLQPKFDLVLTLREGCGKNMLLQNDEVACVCKNHFISYNGKCLLKNDGSYPCADITDCIEQQVEKGTCTSLQRCECTKNYDWSNGETRCVGKNNERSYCDTIDDCFERREDYAECKLNTCACKIGYVWTENEPIHRCALHNDGSEICLDIVDCVDSRAEGADCANGKCICYGLFPIYAKERQRCTAPNDGVYSCGDANDCAEKENGKGQCYQNRCICDLRYVWHTDAKRCLGKSDMHIPCNSLADCYDNTVNTVCSTTCNCAKDTGWADRANKCLPYNNYETPCGWIEDCYDNSSSAQCDDNLCACKPGKYWHLPSLGCKSKNDGIGMCTKLADCMDSDPIRAICDDAMLCHCNKNYIWIDDRSQCIGINNGQTVCKEHKDCVALPIRGSCTNGKCICTTNHKYAEDRKDCLPFNSGDYKCVTLETCADNSYKAICKDTCQCDTNYVWAAQRQKCVGLNNGIPYCDILTEDCYDFRESSAICTDHKCSCKTTNRILSPSSYKCVCTVGTYSPSGDGFSDCTPCNAGFYQNNIGQSKCLPCPTNSYLPTLGAPDINECIICPPNSRSAGGVSRCTCNDDAYDNMRPGGTGSKYCSLCHPFCTKCSGSSTKCLQCVTNNDGIYYENNKCICKTDQGYFIQHGADYTQDKCLKCHPNCVLCYGATFEECYSCIDSIFTEKLINGVACRCGHGNYYDSSDLIEKCKPCAKFCKECSESATNCVECIDNPGIKHTGKCECIVPGYFEYYNATSTNLHKEECVSCYPLCKKCEGPFSNQCQSCYEEKGAILIGTTCICQNNYYYDEIQERCSKCNLLCIGCTQASSDNCLMCNSTIAFSVEQSPKLCVSDCDSINGYYKEGTVCKKCYKDCLHCYGPYPFQCTQCTNPDFVLFNGKCVQECPEHYVNVNSICYECHETCGNCTDTTVNGCINCQLFLYLYMNKCYKRCPDGTFETENFTCQKCQDPCGNCLSLDKCLTCANKKYWYKKENRCVSKEYCQSKLMYGDDISGYCEPCHFSCLTCSGPSKNDCLLCNYEQGFNRTEKDSGQCLMTFCPDGFYLKIDKLVQIARCEECHSSCKTCLSFGAENCTLCKIGLTPYPANIEGFFRCKTCSEISPGFGTTSDYKCTEICGDGKNMGEVECDDGNQISGDGCNNLCKIEDGFKCWHPENEADVCIDIKPPSAILEVKKGNLLIIQFNEIVTVSVDSQALLSKYMDITIEGLKEECPLITNMMSDFKSNANLTSISLRVNATCLLHGVIETYIIKFTHPSYIKDLAGNILNTPVLTARTMRSLYLKK